MDRNAAFALLVKTHGPRLARVARSYARGEERRDLLQEIWLQVWRGLANWRGDAALSTWAYRVALNTAVSHVRRAVRRPEAPLLEPAETPGADTTESERRLLEDFLASLGDADRAAMLLYLEGLSHDEIAEVMGATPGAVGVRLSRLKAAYKRRYLEEGR
jgi:RNA polymerase sigma-70 factor (ECF subfamily)